MAGSQVGDNPKHPEVRVEGHSGRLLAPGGLKKHSRPGKLSPL